MGLEEVCRVASAVNFRSLQPDGFHDSARPGALAAKPSGGSDLAQGADILRVGTSALRAARGRVSVNVLRCFQLELGNLDVNRPIAARPTRPGARNAHPAVCEDFLNGHHISGIYAPAVSTVYSGIGVGISPGAEAEIGGEGSGIRTTVSGSFQGAGGRRYILEASSDGGLRRSDVMADVTVSGIVAVHVGDRVTVHGCDKDGMTAVPDDIAGLQIFHCTVVIALLGGVVAVKAVKGDVLECVSKAHALRAEAEEGVTPALPCVAAVTMSVCRGTRFVRHSVDAPRGLTNVIPVLAVRVHRLKFAQAFGAGVGRCGDVCGEDRAERDGHKKKGDDLFKVFHRLNPFCL